ncbi:hypothetical protein QA612_16075 [Evansella sp. AB-P1]|uniref:hypothetical protein n=1 Tax=Evansella sp. AB-P1 TaxID=3037653 RepID=UPI00241EA638|nr:hypothetical protein [Evansella sp. AB-P1]MDG5788975.1 hypothetical protein [Evansella sp. AB-P1]
MKKKLIAFSVAVLVLSVGTVGFAASNSEEGKTFNFSDMLPFMEKMHPEADEEQLEEMYNNCHGDGGMMSSNSNGGMMNSNMMNQNGK